MCSSGQRFLLMYSRSERQYTTNTYSSQNAWVADLTYTRNARASTSPRSTGFCVIWNCISSSSSSSPLWFALPSNTGTCRGDDYVDQCLGYLRSLGLAESHSANSMRGGRFRRIAHARDVGSLVAELLAPAFLDIIAAFEILYIYLQLTKKLRKNKTQKKHTKTLLQIPHKFFTGSGHFF